MEKPDEFLNPDEYQYLVNSYILGQPFPDGVWQTLFSQQIPENIDSTGPLTVGFTADMLTNDSGNWWESGGINTYIQFPDIGLNFPERWRAVPVKAASIAEQPANCRLEKFNAENLTCTFIKTPAEIEAELWSNGFYSMRGLFVQVGNDPVGPSQSVAYVGDNINLSTRVYNLSLKQMNSSDRIRVQFYRLEWDNTLNVPIGDSILISEEEMATIPPFTSSDTPNWRLVSTKINTQTENMGPDKYWVFWVLVYPVDSVGSLIEELPGYGLDASKFIPGEQFTSILDVPLEFVSIKEFGINVKRSFTNNVGFYKNAVYVSAALVGDGVENDKEPVVFSDKITVTPSEVLVGEQVKIAGNVYSMDASTDGVMVMFHVGHPDEADIAFDNELISYIREDSHANFQVTFQPEFCGEHELYITAADNGTRNPGADIKSVTLNVVCEQGDTNLDGKLIGTNGKPVRSGGRFNRFAEAMASAEIAGTRQGPWGARHSKEREDTGQ